MNKKKKRLIILLGILPLVCLGILLKYRFAAMMPRDIRTVIRQNYNDRELHQEMATAYKHLYTKYPEKAELLYPLGWAYYKIGRITEGYEYLRQYQEKVKWYPSWKDYYITNVRKAAQHAL